MTPGQICHVHAWAHARLQSPHFIYQLCVKLVERATVVQLAHNVGLVATAQVHVSCVVVPLERALERYTVTRMQQPVARGF